MNKFKPLIEYIDMCNDSDYNYGDIDWNGIYVAISECYTMSVKHKSYVSYRGLRYYMYVYRISHGYIGHGIYSSYVIYLSLDEVDIYSVSNGVYLWMGYYVGNLDDIRPLCELRNNRIDRILDKAK